MGLWTTLATKVIGVWPIRQLFIRPIRRQLRAFDQASVDPQATQEALLETILARQRDTDFARDHGFAHIRTVADFRRQVPVARYEQLEPYVARVRRGDLRALLSEPAVHMFAMTSGTTAARKFIPVTGQYLRDYRRGWNMWGLRIFRDHPFTRLRPIVQLSSDWDEFRTEANIPCGSITGLTAQIQKPYIRWLYLVPACTGRIKDTHAKYYAALRLSMPRHVGWIVAANPSTLLNLARFGDQEKESLIRDIFDGTLSSRFNIPADVRQELTRRLKPNPRRARELEAIASRHGCLYPKDYWGHPNRFLIGTWTGGTVGVYLRQFPRYFGGPENAVVRDIGLIASEGRMTIPMADGTPAGVLDVTTHYFEFIPEAEGDSAAPTVLGAHELEEGKNYFILPTTSYGLYRYHIHDVVRVAGFHNRTPVLEFLSKGAHFANLTGEKLSEYHVVHAMRDVTHELNLNLTTYSLAPCWEEERPYYGLFLEKADLVSRDQGLHLAEALDRRLAQLNSEYACKRETLRLDPVRLQLLPNGTWQLWDRQRLARCGGTPEQYKHPCLINDLQFRQSMPVEEEISLCCSGNGGSRTS